ncbi:ABC transporter permease, partial [Crocinitomicaceae bacterium]|nr:ABC transporter permease [Crocinitomicaceae bacterium]
MFVAIGNSILEIQGMFMEYWLLLFSISCLSNMVGLNISSTFNTAKVIYIFVPLVIIPQLLFSGVIVKFDKLHPSLSHATEVPIIGNIMPSRWAYEALIVEQTSQNKLSSIFLNFDILKSQATWKKDYWLPKLQNELNILTNSESTVTQKKIARELLTNEIKKEDLVWTDLKCESCIENLSFSTITEEDIRPINVFLSILRKQYIYTINTSIDSIRIRKEKMGIENYRKLRNEYTNEALENILTNKLELNKTITLNGELYQNSDPIYNLPQKHSFFTSHFYSPYKYIFGSRVSTFYGNLMVIWGMVFLGYFLLYFDVFKKLFSRLTSISLK